MLVTWPGHLSTAWPSQGCSCQLLAAQGSQSLPGMLWGALPLHIRTKPNCRTENSSAEGDGFTFPHFIQTFLDEDANGEAVQFGWEHRHPEESLMEQPCLHTRTGLCHRVTVSAWWCPAAVSPVDTSCWGRCGVTLYHEVQGPKGRSISGWHQQSAGKLVHLGHNTLTNLQQDLAEQSRLGSYRRVIFYLVIFPSPETEDPGFISFYSDRPGLNLSVGNSCLCPREGFKIKLVQIYGTMSR